MWLTNIQSKAINNTNYLLLIAYIWFAAAIKKPPDKKKINSFIKTLLDIMSEGMTTIFDVNYRFGFWISFILYYLPWTECKLDPGIHLNKYKYELRSKTTFQSRTVNLVKRLEGRTLYSNVALSYSTYVRGNNDPTNPLSLESKDYYFAVDTATSFHVCKQKGLFVDNLKTAKNIFVKGIGGKTKVRGYGTIAINVIDDDDRECDLIISNVLYVPDSPANLISPQLWSECVEILSDTGDFTVGGTTIMFWNENKYSKLIQHHPELKIPIFIAHSAQAKATQHAEFPLQQAANPTCLHTSIPIRTVDEQGHENVHIIPLDDDGVSIHRLSP